MDSWRRGTNSLTGDAVTVHWARPVDADFHPRYGATARRYLFLFHESDNPSPLMDGYAVRSRRLNDAAMHLAAASLVGEHDFSSFRAAGCQSASPYRRVDRISVQRFGNLVVLDVQANAFLLHMVRNIAGALWQVGLEARPVAWIADLLLARNRNLAAATAPPQGLYLVAVHYPDYDFPAAPLPGLLRALGGLDRLG